jgi:hypothetical protein
VVVLFTASAVHAESGSRAGVASLRTVFLIVMENHDWSQIVGSRSARYINGTLLPLGAHATRYYNPPGMHPSLPNYLWLEAGGNLGVRDDGPPSQHTQTTGDHLVRLLDGAGVSWRAYEQGIDGRTCPLTDRYPYATRHNPMIYFSDVTANANPKGAYCIRHERPLTQLGGDLARNSVARYNFITPDVCHDMHDDCSPAFNSVYQGDRFLSQLVPQILRSKSYRQGGAVFITWDEGEGNDGPIGMILLSSQARRGYAANVRYTHGSTLRTIEEIFHVRPLLRDAAKAADLRALFSRFPG